MMGNITESDNAGFSPEFYGSMGEMMDQPGMEAMHTVMMNSHHDGGFNNQWSSQPMYQNYRSVDFFHLLGSVNLILLAILLATLIRYFWVKGGK